MKSSLFQLFIHIPTRRRGQIFQAQQSSPAPSCECGFSIHRPPSLYYSSCTIYGKRSERARFDRSGLAPARLDTYQLSKILNTIFVILFAIFDVLVCDSCCCCFFRTHRPALHHYLATYTEKAEPTPHDPNFTVSQGSPCELGRA